MVDEIAKMLNEDALRKGLPVLPWEVLLEAGKCFWRKRAEAFISSVEP